MNDNNLFACSVSESLFNEYLKLARDGSSSGLGCMLDSFRPALLEMAAEQLGARVRRRMSASDLVQDTLLSAGHQFPSFRGNSLAEFRNWLRELFHSRLVDGLRRHQRAEMRRQGLEEEAASLSQLASGEESPSSIAGLREEANLLLKGIQELSEEHQRIIQLRYLEDRTFEDIADALSVSVATVWRRFQEATETLHRRLQE